jgi:hypothetical protein
MTAALQPGGTTFEKHFSTDELAAIWGLSPDFLRDMLENEPGVVIFNGAPKPDKRRYRTMRIPASVAQRVHARLTVHGRA